MAIGSSAPRDTVPRTAALRWFAVVFLLILGISFLIPPRGSADPLYSLLWLRGPLFVLAGLVLLWMCILRLSRPVWIAGHLLVAIPPLAVAAEYIYNADYLPAAAFILLGLGLALSPFAPAR